MTIQKLFGLAVLGIALPRIALCISCQVAAPHIPSPAETALLNDDYERAASLYTQALAQKANDPELVAGLVEALLQQQKVAQASETAIKALGVNPKSAVLETALGFVQLRAGMPWLAAETAQKSRSLDPCYARSHLLTASLLRLNSMYKSAADELKTAHLLDPNDPAIRRSWLRTLPLDQRIKETEADLASYSGGNPDKGKGMRQYVESLKKAASEPHKSCQIASSTTSTELPFAPLMRDGQHVRTYGLEVKLNNHSARFEVDTGSSGLLISRSVAKLAGLTSFDTTEVAGIGDHGVKSAYTAYVDSIKIGSLEFRDCAVTVLENRSVAGEDGLIGMDLFSNLLVTLDYPMHKIVLAPLPPRPQDALNNQPSLTTGTEQSTGPQDRLIPPSMNDWTKVYRAGHQLLIPAALNKSKIKLFILDTGSFATTISPEAAREVTKVHNDYDDKVQGISGQVEKVYRTGDLTFEFANLRQTAWDVIAFDTSNISKSTGLEVSGIIGISTLRQLTLTIDYRDGLVHFSYNPNRGYRDSSF